MLRALSLAGVVALTALPAAGNQMQLAQAAGVEPGKYSTAQLVTLIELRRENGNRAVINRILANPEGGALVPRLSTTQMPGKK